MSCSEDPEDPARLAQVVRKTSSAVILTDTAGAIVWVNRAFSRLTGYRLDEARGQRPGELLQGPETDRDEVRRIGAALRARQRVVAELVNYAKDGRRYWVGMKIEPLADEASGELSGFMAIAAEITERREQLLALERSKRRFDLATRAARVGMFERDDNFEIVWWSEMMWEIFGQSPASFRPSNESWLNLIHPQDRERMREHVLRLGETPAPIDLQYRIVRPDGELRHLRSLGAPAERDAGEGERERVYGMVLDVTERVQAEERERVLQRQLRDTSHQAGMAEIVTGVLHNVGNLLNSLGTANAAARRELKSLRVDRLEQATTMLRDHRELLAQFLTQDERGRHLPDYLPALSAHMAANSRAIQAELETMEHLLQLLNDIVSAQQQLARVGGRREPVGLQELVETALRVQSAELAHIEVVREFEELPPIETDRHKLLQIIVNLLSNARDAVQAGAPQGGRIRVQLRRDGDHARLTVSDSGIGMSEEVLAQLWRFGFTTKKNGHGFGLHNSANAAHEIGAALTAHSDGVGKGSCFTLSLPLRAEPMLPGVAA